MVLPIISKRIFLFNVVWGAFFAFLSRFSSHCHSCPTKVFLSCSDFFVCFIWVFFFDCFFILYYLYLEWFWLSSPQGELCLSLIQTIILCMGINNLFLTFLLLDVCDPIFLDWDIHPKLIKHKVNNSLHFPVLIFLLTWLVCSCNCKPML